MRKSLVIVSGYADFSQIMGMNGSDTDVLAFDLPAMQACRFSALSFLTPDDLYSSHEFRRTFGQTLNKLERLFENLDRKYAGVIAYPHAFKSNIYPFLCYFADLHYIGGLARAIQQRYVNKRIITAGSEDIETHGSLMPMACGIFDNQVFIKSNASIYNLRHLAKLLGHRPVARVRQSQEDWFEHCSLCNLSHRYGYLLRPANWGVVVDKLKAKSEMRLKSSHRQKVIWCIQDGYDVAALKKYLPGYTFLDPIKSLLKLQKNLSGKSIESFCHEAVETLIEFYPEWEIEITELMEKYHMGVVCHLAPLAECITEQINTSLPECALYSIGAVVPLEALYAWVLNQCKVPIYAFQHGGSNLYFNTPLNKYIEFNPDIAQTTFCVSKVEGDLRNQGDRQSQVVSTGGIKMFELHEECQKRTKLPGNGRVLFVQGRYPSEMWKNLFCTEGEDRIFAKHEQFFELASQYNLMLDIKLYPGTAKICAPYFRRFAQRYVMKDTRLLYSEPAELIASKYSLIIMEYIGSALNVFFMLLNRPVIYYLSEHDMVNPAISTDFYQRHYVAHDRTVLAELLRRFRQGTLVTRYSPDYLDKYVFPVDEVSPGLRIATLIKTASKRGITESGVEPS